MKQTGAMQIQNHPSFAQPLQHNSASCSQQLSAPIHDVKILLNMSFGTLKSHFRYYQTQHGFFSINMQSIDMQMLSNHQLLKEYTTSANICTFLIWHNLNECSPQRLENWHEAAVHCLCVLLLWSKTYPAVSPACILTSCEFVCVF